jgi:glutamate-5-semialdehyde dehydrogenase
MDYSLYFQNAKAATAQMTELSPDRINGVLKDLAAAIVRQTPLLLEANQKDLARMDPADPRYDRLELTPARIETIARDILNVAALETPLNRTLSEKILPNGLEISKVTVPLGVVGMIYEARPNVTADAFTLCFKTGNVALLKGGSDADDSNRALLGICHTVLGQHGTDPAVVQLLPAERASTQALLHATGWVDVVIPRGSQQLINFVRENARVPVIETGAGVVHTYLDETGDLVKGADIVFNAKTRRVSVCNALDCLLVHTARIKDLAALLKPMETKRVEICADPAAYAALSGHYPAELLFPATEADYGTEFLSLKMAVRTVTGLEEALAHIRLHSSGHSEAILSENPENTARFIQAVDAAAVYVNASTAFTDGAEFGLGAEIGISTQKLHARGPMGLDALVSYKWIVRGNGQTRQG